MVSTSTSTTSGRASRKVPSRTAPRKTSARPTRASCSTGVCSSTRSARTRPAGWSSRCRPRGRPPSTASARPQASTSTGSSPTRRDGGNRPGRHETAARPEGKFVSPLQISMACCAEDPFELRSRSGDGARRNGDEHASPQGHFAQDRVRGLHAGRRRWHSRDAGCSRHHDGARRVDVPRHRGRPTRAGSSAICTSPTAAGAVRHARALKGAVNKLAAAGYEFVAGLEVEFHVFRIRDPRLQPTDAGQPGNPPEVELLTTGYQLLTEHKYDQLEPVVELLRDNLERLELPLRSFEIEFGPSQLEFTLAPRAGIAAADAMVLLRSAVEADRAPPRLPRHFHVPRNCRTSCRAAGICNRSPGTG